MTQGESREYDFAASGAHGATPGRIIDQLLDGGGESVNVLWRDEQSVAFVKYDFPAAGTVCGDASASASGRFNEDLGYALAISRRQANNITLRICSGHIIAFSLPFDQAGIMPGFKLRRRDIQGAGCFLRIRPRENAPCCEAGAPPRQNRRRLFARAGDQRRGQAACPLASQGGAWNSVSSTPEPRISLVLSRLIKPRSTKSRRSSGFWKIMCMLAPPSASLKAG